MSNIKTALESAIEALEINHEHKAVEQCKSALAELEKCEPVLKVTNNGTQLSLTKINGDYWDMSKYIGEVFYTSPPQREWVGLSAADRSELFKGGVTMGDLITATEAKCKQLNTKG